MVGDKVYLLTTDVDCQSSFHLQLDAVSTGVRSDHVDFLDVRWWMIENVLIYWQFSMSFDTVQQLVTCCLSSYVGWL